MTDIRALVQETLDDTLYDDGVSVSWLRKSDGDDPDEYVVYTLDGDPVETYADDAPLIRSANVAIRYHYRDSLIESSAGRTAIKARENQIADALTAAGFILPSGYFDAGDIDGIGFGATVFESYYGRAE